MSHQTVSWKSRTLNKSQGMRLDEGDVSMVIDHVDRRIDPYLVTVIHRGVIVYTGLHSSLGDARAKCTQEMKELPSCQK